MSNFEVQQPILNSPYAEPKEDSWILEGQTAERRPGRRPAMYFYRDTAARPSERGNLPGSIGIELRLVNLIRERLKAWRAQDYPGDNRGRRSLAGPGRLDQVSLDERRSRLRVQELAWRAAPGVTLF